MSAPPLYRLVMRYAREGAITTEQIVARSHDIAALVALQDQLLALGYQFEKLERM